MVARSRRASLAVMRGIRTAVTAAAAAPIASATSCSSRRRIAAALTASIILMLLVPALVMTGGATPPPCHTASTRSAARKGERLSAPRVATAGGATATATADCRQNAGGREVQTHAAAVIASGAGTARRAVVPLARASTFKRGEQAAAIRGDDCTLGERAIPRVLGRLCAGAVRSLLGCKPLAPVHRPVTVLVGSRKGLVH